MIKYRKLTDLLNIGKVLSIKLKACGITSVEELIKEGSKKALIRISSIEESNICINMLYALEGAIQGIRWHDLDSKQKDELKIFFNQIWINSL